MFCFIVQNILAQQQNQPEPTKKQMNLNVANKTLLRVCAKMSIRSVTRVMKDNLHVCADWVS